jgi:hypothetical protein
MKGNDKVRMLDQKEAAKLFDAQAKQFLGITGDEFRQRWSAGTLAGMDTSAVSRMAMLLPLVED